MSQESEQIERTVYASSILVAQKPIDAAEIVRVRLSQAKLLNDEVAEFFRRYYQIKAAYVKELGTLVTQCEDLNKSVERGMIEKNVLSREELRHFNVDATGELSTVWRKIINEIKDDIIGSNELRQVVQREVAAPLATYTAKNQQWSDMRSMHAKLKEVARDIEVSEEKVAKHRADGKAEKLHKYEEQLQQANSSWQTSAPFVFEVFENTDASRLDLLKGTLLKFSTAYSDALMKTSGSNEQTLEAILNFDTEREIQRFAKAASEAQYVPRAAREAAESSVREQKSAATPIPASPYPVAALDVRSSAVKGSPIKNAESKTRTKLRSRVGSIFRKKDKKTPINTSVALPESEVSSVEAPRNDSRASSFMRVSNRSVGDIAEQQAPGSSLVSPFRQQGAPAPVSKSQGANQGYNQGYSVSPQSGNQQTASQGYSVNQAPLQPVMRLSGPNMQNANSSYSDGSAQYGTPETEASNYQDETLQQLESSRAPPPPPASRKTNLANIHEDGAFDANSIHQTPHGELPRPPAQARRDIQSQLFTGLENTNRENAQTKRQSSVASIGTASQLRPQATGSSLGASAIFQHPEMGYPGLNASIVEVVSAKFRDGEQSSSQIVGEIAFNYNGSESQAKTVKITGASLGKVVPNTQFIKQIDANEFEVDVSSVLGRTVGGLKYSLKEAPAPIVVLPVWRFEAHQASVMLTLKLAPHVTESIELSDVVVSVAIDGVAKSALSKPQGTFNKDKARVTWKFVTPLTLSANSEQKLVARFITDSEAREDDKGVMTKFTINEADSVVSKLQLFAQNYDHEDPFGESEWTVVPSSKMLVAGNYSGLAQ